MTITFTQSYKTGTTPNVVASVNQNDPTKLQTLEVYDVTSTGFTVRKKSLTSGSATVNADANIGFTWISIGTI